MEYVVKFQHNVPVAIQKRSNARTSPELSFPLKREAMFYTGKWFPACAGKTLYMIEWRNSDAMVPRVRGEDTSLAVPYQSQQLSGGSMTEQQGNLYAPPQARVEDVHAEGDFELAGRGTRFGAAFIDGLIYLAVYFAVLIPVIGVNFQQMATMGAGKQIMMQILGMAIFLGLNGYLLAKNGQTIAKKLLSIKIVRSDGSPADFRRIVLLRLLPAWLVAMVPFLGIFLVMIDPLFIFRESRKCVHDSIADTIVVKA
jgi:uncharacterized RDD family membrane protein YckC